MTKRRIAKLGVAALIAACAGVATAQTNGPSGFSARLGLFLPTNDFGRDLGDTWFTGGLDYKLNTYRVDSPNATNPAFIGLSADFYGHGSNTNIPLAVTYNVRSNQLVWSAGVGVDFYNIDDLSDSGTGLGGQLAVTYEFAQGASAANPLFLQAKYFLTRKSELSGFGIYLGYRF